MDMYDLYEVLDSRILDRIIQTKWNGKYDLNASFSNYSTSMTILKDKNGIFAGDLVFAEIQYAALRLERPELVHYFKFEVWKKSMQLRAMIDLFFQLFVVFYFQYGLYLYTTYEVDSTKVAKKLYYELDPVENYEDYKKYTKKLHYDFKYLAYDLNMVLLISYLNFLFPVNIFAEYILTSKTNRRGEDWGIDFYNDLILFIMTFVVQK